MSSLDDLTVMIQVHIDLSKACLETIMQSKSVIM